MLYEGINTGEKDYSALVSKIKQSGADLVYFGGLYTEGGLIVRQMRDQGVKAPLMGGDGITSDEFASVGGPGVEGTLMTYGPDPRNKPEAKAVVAEFRAKKFEPEAYTLYSYAGVQIIKQAAEAAKSADPKKVADMMHSGMNFKTVLGDISYDKKGDITKLDYVMYIWKKDASGKITYVECPESGCTMYACERSKPLAAMPRSLLELQPILPSIGNVSSSQKLAWLTAPVRNAMPVSTRRPPIAFSTRPRWVRKRARKAANGSTAKRRDDERHAEAERIDREHAGALRHGRFRRRDREDRGEDRADARRPAERKGKPHQIGAPQADRLGDFKPLLAHQPARSASGRGNAAP